MSIAAKCICGGSLYYCVGAIGCPYVYNGELAPVWDAFKESRERVNKQKQEELIRNLKFVTVIMPK